MGASEYGSGRMFVNLMDVNDSVDGSGEGSVEGSLAVGVEVEVEEDCMPSPKRAAILE